MLFSCRHVRLFATPWTVAHQAPLSMGIFQARILEWVAMPPSGDFPIPGIVPMSPALAGRFLTTETLGKSMIMFCCCCCCCYTVTKLGPTLQPHGLQHTRFPSPSLSLGVCSNSYRSVSDAIQLSHPLLLPSLLAVSLSQHQGLFQWVSSSHQMAKVSEHHFRISSSNEYSEVIYFRIDWFDLLAVKGTLKRCLQNTQNQI